MAVTYRNTVTGRREYREAPDAVMDRSRRWERVEDPAPAPTGIDRDEAPAGNASTETWREYAIGRGLDPAEAAELSRGELRDRYGDG